MQIVVQFKGVDDDITDADSLALAAKMLREKFRAVGYGMMTDPVPGRPEPVSLNETRDGWRPFEPGLGALDGHIIEWTATGAPAATDPAPISGHLFHPPAIVQPDGSQVVPPPVYIGVVPAEVTSFGGSVRVRHGLGVPVIVHAYADAEATKGIGYHFTQPVSDNEEHMELVPGTVVVNVTIDPDPEGLLTPAEA